jgi:sialidase-1
MIVMLATAIEGGVGAADDDISVLVCPATNEHPRSSEASVVALKDGRLLLAYSEFIGAGADDSPAQIMAKTSADGGRTWSEAWVLQPNAGKQNVMSASLLRLKSGRLMLGYLVKNSSSDLRVEIRLSGDEGETWGQPVRADRRGGYHRLATRCSLPRLLPAV